MPKLPGARALGKAIEVDPALPPSFYAALGRKVVGGLAVRPDRLERLAAAACSRKAPFAGDDELAGLVGVAPADLHRLLAGLGYRTVVRDGAELFVARPRRAKPARAYPARHLVRGEGHPFAKLRELRLA